MFRTFYDMIFFPLIVFILVMKQNHTLSKSREHHRIIYCYWILVNVEVIHFDSYLSRIRIEWLSSSLWGDYFIWNQISLSLSICNLSFCFTIFFCINFALKVSMMFFNGKQAFQFNLIYWSLSNFYNAIWVLLLFYANFPYLFRQSDLAIDFYHLRFFVKRTWNER